MEVYVILIDIRNELEKLSVTQAWSLRETDLYDFQRQLDKIDESRVGGNWLDEEGNPAELYVQRVCGQDFESHFQLNELGTNTLDRPSFTSSDEVMASSIP
jgi:hypothetical protein